MSVYDRLLGSDVIVLELSSYMLEDFSTFRADISIITNISSDHLDRYESIDDYAGCKFRLLKNCDQNDLFVRNIDDERLRIFKAGQRTLRISTRDSTALCREP